MVYVAVQCVPTGFANSVNGHMLFNILTSTEIVQEPAASGKAEEQIYLSRARTITEHSMSRSIVRADMNRLESPPESSDF